MPARSGPALAADVQSGMASSTMVWHLVSVYLPCWHCCLPGGRAGVRGKVIRAPINLQDIFHPTDKLSVVLGWDAPALLQIGLDLVFLARCGQSHKKSTPHTPRPPSGRPGRRRVQRACPSRAGLQARANSRASCAPSSRQTSARERSRAARRRSSGRRRSTGPGARGRGWR
jgi:hypothetical protein